MACPQVRLFSKRPRNDNKMEARNLKTDPAWQSQDLGQPLPDSSHACSVCLPTWESVIGYEEERDKVLRRLRSGYPRFILNGHVRKLCEQAEANLGQKGERVLLFTTKAVAQRAQRFVEKRHSAATRVASYEGLQALAVGESAYGSALLYWRFSGEIVSSRQAEDTLNHEQQPADDQIHGYMARKFVCSKANLFLYESGMAAVFSLHRAVTAMSPGRKTLQLDFPYVDVLKVQENFGAGVVFLPDADGEHFDEALSRVRTGEFSAIFCEIPSNPLLSTVDLIRLSEAAREGRTPLIADDTVVSHHNVDLLPHVDAVTTSLTKWVSGRGDVSAGAVRVNQSSPFATTLLAQLNETNPTHNRIYARDAVVLRANADQFPKRMKSVNRNGEAIADFLSNHPAVEQVWYPKFLKSESYLAVKRQTGGYGGLVSFTLRNEKKAPKVYDALMWNKGPSLGTEFSLACPYTLLAHYPELDWAAGCGVPSNLIRLSAGIEPTGQLLNALEIALEQG